MGTMGAVYAELGFPGSARGARSRTPATSATGRAGGREPEPARPDTAKVGPLRSRSPSCAPRSTSAGAGSGARRDGQSERLATPLVSEARGEAESLAHAPPERRARRHPAVAESLTPWLRLWTEEGGVEDLLREALELRTEPSKAPFTAEAPQNLARSSRGGRQAESIPLFQKSLDIARSTARCTRSVPASTACLRAARHGRPRRRRSSSRPDRDAASAPRFHPDLGKR